MTMLEFLVLLVCGGILVSGALAVFLKGLVPAMVSAGLASLFAAVSYVLLAAPDVAMAEAAIGSGLATLIFLYAIRKTRGHDVEGEE
jgi:energy-converting hydrogenase B subunit D